MTASFFKYFLKLLFIYLPALGLDCGNVESFIAACEGLVPCPGTKPGPLH